MHVREPSSAKKPVIGLIGGVGSGKSLAAAEFGKYGARVISGDELGHEALRQSKIKEQVVRHWGPEILNAKGDVDRRKLGAIVFADAKERQALEALLFPWIERRIGEEIARAADDAAVKFVVLDAAVMLEACWDRMCDRIIYVDAPREQRLKRLAGQRGWTTQQVHDREKAQWPMDEKRKRADATLDNSGTPDALARQIQKLVEQWGILENPKGDV
jgi:dephospho-CoA kinase